MLGLIVAIHFGFNLLLNPIGTPVTGAIKWLMLMFVGATIVQPALFAIWTSLGPGPSSWRVPITTAAFAIVVFGAYCQTFNIYASPNSSKWADAESVAFPAVVYIVSAAGLVLVRKLTRWRIMQRRDTAAFSSNTRQFSMKFVLGYTAICAALLASGHVLTSHGWLGPGADRLASMLTGIGGALVITLPTFAIPLMALANRISISAVIAMLFVWVALSLLAVEAIVRLNPSEIRSTVVIEVGFVQLGAAVTGLLSAVLLRLGGYRLVDLADTARNSQPTV
jgi:hypothetical protein